MATVAVYDKYLVRTRRVKPEQFKRTVGIGQSGEVGKRARTSGNEYRCIFDGLIAGVDDPARQRESGHEGMEKAGTQLRPGGYVQAPSAFQFWMLLKTACTMRVAELPDECPLVWMPTAERTFPSFTHTGAPLCPPIVSIS